jgi:transposase
VKPYSKEFRGQVLAACDRGRSTREVATHFEVSESWVRRIKQECRELNKTAPLLTRRRIPLWAALADQMQEIIRTKPDLTLRELKAELQIDLSVQTLCTALKRLRLTIKKSPRRLGAGAAGRCREAGNAEARTSAPGSGSARFSRRNMGQIKYDPSARQGPKRPASLWACATRPLEDDDLFSQRYAPRASLPR